MVETGLVNMYSRACLALALVVAGGVAMLLPDTALAEVRIERAQTQLQAQVYTLDARLHYGLTEPMLEALHSSVPLTFVLHIEVYSQRDYWWDDTLLELEQHYELTYQPLTQHYLVKNLNSGAKYSLPALDVALAVLGTIVELPLIDTNLLPAGEIYQVRMQAQLDIERLPVPLRLLSYFSDLWRLRSEWYEWPLIP